MARRLFLAARAKHGPLSKGPTQNMRSGCVYDGALFQITHIEGLAVGSIHDYQPSVVVCCISNSINCIPITPKDAAARLTNYFVARVAPKQLFCYIVAQSATL